MTKHIVCYSGGHSSAIVAIEVCRKYGKENVILLNHNINNKKENADIKRFKIEVSAFLKIPITYANYGGELDDSRIPNQFDIAKMKKGFKSPNSDSAFCTHELKTKPFEHWLSVNFPRGGDLFKAHTDCVIYYGFDANEPRRIKRRVSILSAMGYKSDYPLAIWKERTIHSTNEIGISPPLKYEVTKHANCDGCLKGGLQHWYVTYVHHNDTFNEAKDTEQQLGYSILRRTKNKEKYKAWLIDLEPTFEKMKKSGVPANEHYKNSEFNKFLRQYELDGFDENKKPCECVV